MSKATGTRIGYISACIAGDHRYTSKVEVYLDGDKAHVLLLENGAVGGMDGPGGSEPFRTTRTTTVDASGKAILKAVKSTMDDVIKRYGKPTKNFTWVADDDEEGRRRQGRGLSVKVVEDAIKTGS